MNEIEDLWNGTESFEIHTNVKDNSIKSDMSLNIKSTSDKMLKALLPQFNFKNEYLEIKNLSLEVALEYYVSLNYTCK